MIKYLITLTAAFFTLTTALYSSDDVQVIYAGKLINSDSGRVESNQTIIITGERITNIGNRDEVNVPDGAKVTDLSNYTVLPGLIDAHAHIMSAKDQQQFKRSTASIAIRGVVNAAKIMQYGYTTVRTAGEPGYTDTALRDAINKGIVVGPRIKASGPYIGPTGGCNDPNIKMSASNQVTAVHHVDGVDAVRKEIRKHTLRGVDHIKTCTSGTVLSGTGGLNETEWSTAEIEALVDEAHMHGLKVAVHTHSTNGIKKAILAGADSIEHASFLDRETIKLAKKHKTALVMDIYWTDWIQEEGPNNGMTPDMLRRDREVGQKQRDNFRRAHKAGANIVFGTDVGGFPFGLNSRQFSTMVEYGMTPIEAIQAATVKAAALLGMSDDVGSLKIGKYADIIAVKADPIQDISVLEDINFVMKGGVVHKSK